MLKVIKLLKFSNIVSSSTRRKFATFNYIDDSNNIKTVFYDNHFEISILNDNVAETKKYPSIWLRDSCKCNICFDTQNSQHLIDFKSLSLDVKPYFISSSIQKKSQIKVEWSDGHSSIYNLIDLAKFIFEDYYKNSNKNYPIYWNNEIIKDKLNSLTFSYDDYMHNEKTLKLALKSLVVYGIMILKNAPYSVDDTKKAIERIAYIQKTLYGDQTILTAQPERADNSFSNIGLGAHNDGTYLKNSPGLQIFQILQESKTGGDSLIVDGFYCAEKLKNLHKDEFDFLTKVTSEAIYKEKEKYNVSHCDPIIKLNPLNGSLMQIRYNLYDRSIFNYLSYEDTIKYYKSIKRFSEIIQNPNNELWLRLKKDEIVFIDNFRLLHGRSSFEGDRILFTAYAPRDEWISKAKLFNVI